MPAPKPTKAHLLGSIAVPTNKDAFTLASRILGSKLSRIPDGETAHRFNWVMFQYQKLPSRVKKNFTEPGGDGPQTEPDPPLQLSEFPETTYDEEAIASYEVFKQLRSEGVIPTGIKFQVCLPTLASLVRPVVYTRYCVAVEKHLETRMMSALRRIQDFIPAGDLCIQFDMANEMAQLEYDRLGADWQAAAKPYLDPPLEGFMERLARWAKNVDANVELGMHVCYGDVHHHHFVEPVDAGMLVKYVNAVTKTVQPLHEISYFHIPVPKERDDEAYFLPLKDLKYDGMLYLGVAREEDEEGSRRRMETAQKVLDREFGISTECGLGRVGSAALAESAIKVMNALTE